MYQSDQLILHKVAARMAFEQGKINSVKHKELMSKIEILEIEERIKQENTKRLLKVAKSNFKYKYHNDFTTV